MKTKEQEQAAKDAQAIETYAQFEATVAEVAVERGPKRVKAIRLAAQLIADGYSLRKAAKLAGRKPDTSYDRYFTVARALESDGSEGATPCPEGFGNWLDAIAGMALPKLVEHVKMHRSPPKLAPADKAIRQAVNGALKTLEILIAGKSKSKSLKNLSVGKAQVAAYVKAWADAGCTVKGLDSMSLTPLDTQGRAIVADVKAAVADAKASMSQTGMTAAQAVETGEVTETGEQDMPAVVNG